MLGTAAQVATDARRTPPFRLGHRPNLDGVRGFAIVAVVVYHVGHLLWFDARFWFLPGGFLGVDLFFALSGFLITSLLLAEFDRRGRTNVVRFLGRRALRLLPALMFVLAGIVALAAFDLIPSGTRWAIGRSLWTLAFLQNAPATDHMVHPELAQSWSLAVEGHFYVLWSITVAVVLLLARRRSRQLLFAIGLIAVVAVMVHRAMTFNDGVPALALFLKTPERLDGPLVGALGGIAFASGWLDRLSQRWAALLTGAGLVVLALAARFVDPFDEFHYSRGGLTMLAGVGIVVVVGAALLTGGPVSRLLQFRPLVAMGKCSYSLYLWHMPVFVILNRETTSWSNPVRVVVALAATGVLTAVSYFGVERPIMRRASASARRDRGELVEQLVREQGGTHPHGGGVDPTHRPAQTSAVAGRR
jgi:peptidoglycan/LPS O-acetylase OafA/YrhL